MRTWCVVQISSCRWRAETALSAVAGQSTTPRRTCCSKHFFSMRRLELLDARSPRLVPAARRDTCAGVAAAPIQPALTIPDNHAVSRYRNHAGSMQPMAARRINKAGGVAF
jgi:hypothetical protein